MDPLTIAMLISSGISLFGMIASANAQKKAADKQSQYLEDAANAAANTPLAKAQRKMSLDASERIEEDDYEGLNVNEKRNMMRLALEGYNASIRGAEIELRQLIGRMGFGRSGQVQEALSDLNEGSKDVAAKTATAANRLSAEIGQMEKSRDLSIIQGTPDTQAQALLQIGAAKAQHAQQIGEVAATKAAGIAGMLSGAALQDIPYGYQPWWADKPIRDLPLSRYGGVHGWNPMFGQVSQPGSMGRFSAWTGVTAPQGTPALMQQQYR